MCEGILRIHIDEDDLFFRVCLPAISEYAFTVFADENDLSPSRAIQLLRKEIEPFPRFHAFHSLKIFFEEIEKPFVAEANKAITELFLKRKKK